MADRSNLYVDTEQTFTVGQDTFVDSTSENNHTVIFEDNLETGYFYAADRNNELKVLDALHIYNVAGVKDKHKLSVVKILWTKDSTKAFLVINDYCHAVFDFKNKAGYCRNAFPDNNRGWTKISDRKLTDSLLESFISADT